MVAKLATILSSTDRALVVCQLYVHVFHTKNPDQAYEEMASGFEEVTAEDVASDVKGLKFFGKEDNEKLNDESNADSIYVISQKTGSSEVRKF